MALFCMNTFQDFKNIIQHLDDMPQLAQVLISTEEEFVHVASVNKLGHEKLTLEWGLECNLCDKYKLSIPELHSYLHSYDICSLFWLSVERLFKWLNAQQVFAEVGGTRSQIRGEIISLFLARNRYVISSILSAPQISIDRDTIVRETCKICD